MQHHWQRLVDGDIRTPTTPEELWEMAIKYFHWCDSNPIIQTKTVMTGKEAGKKVTEETSRPYSLKALCIHLGLSEQYFSDVKAAGVHTLYYAVVMRIMYIIYVQNQELATVGVFSPIFTAKMLGLDKPEDPEQREYTVKVIALQGANALSNSESEVFKNIELEKGEPVIKAQ
jgi:DNA-packaging protein gp3